MTTEWKDLPTFQDVAEAQAQGWEVQTDAGTTTFAEWLGETWYTRWKYRARPPQPKMKKVNLAAYLDLQGEFRRVNEASFANSNWTRVPSEDKEIEVPE